MTKDRKIGLGLLGVVLAIGAFNWLKGEPERQRARAIEAERSAAHAKEQSNLAKVLEPRVSEQGVFKCKVWVYDIVAGESVPNRETTGTVVQHEKNYGINASFFNLDVKGDSEYSRFNDGTFYGHSTMNNGMEVYRYRIKGKMNYQVVTKSMKYVLTDCK